MSNLTKSKMNNVHDPLGDTISAVQLLDHMGTDLTVVNAARVSMDKRSTWAFEWAPDAIADVTPHQIKVLSKRDIKLINYLAEHNHWTPFSHCVVTLRIKMPIFIARQWFKHQVGFTRNEVSRRYVDTPPEFYNPTHWRKRAENVKQGSSDEVVEANTAGMQAYYDEVEEQYLRAVTEEGIAPEMARMILPQSMYTEFWETASLAAYARLCSLRLDPHAQKEIRDYAEAVDSILAKLFPVSWAALTGGYQP